MFVMMINGEYLRGGVKLEIPSAEMLCFMLDLMDNGTTLCTIRGYLVPTSSCHVGFWNEPIGQHFVMASSLDLSGWYVNCSGPKVLGSNEVMKVLIGLLKIFTTDVRAVGL